MRKKSRLKNIMFILAMFSFMSGCKFVREIDTDEIDFANEKESETSEGIDWDTISSIDTMSSIVVEDGSLMDIDAILNYFYGESKEELLQGGYLTEDDLSEEGLGYNAYCEKNGINLIFAEQADLENNKLMVSDMREAAGTRYESVLEDKFLVNEISKGLTDMYPKGELESCSGEEAIAACAELAKACGYEDAQVDVYVMKKEVLNNYAEEARISDREGFYVNAPDPEYDITIDEQIEEAIRREDYDLAGELMGKKFGTGERIMWTDRTEAYLLIYRPVLNDYLFECRYYNLMCVYVPSYGRVVYVKGYRPLEVEEILEAEEVISVQDAIAEVLRVKKINSTEDITVTGISMIYAPRYEKIAPGLEKRIVEPCWRIDYELNEDVLKSNPSLYYNDDGTVLINAIDGKENTLS